MKFWNHYHVPTSLDEALNLLARYDGRARLVAGGTDFFLDLQSDYYEGKRPFYDALIDVTRLAEAKDIRADGDWLVIGCAVTHAQIVASALIQKHATALAEACGVIGGPQVRNVATLVGNVAHALPAADGTLALMALGAEALVANSKFVIRNSKFKIQNSKSAIRNPQSAIECRPLASLFRGPGESAVDATREMIVAVRFRPTGEGEGSAFARVMRPQGIALPILGMAARGKIEIRNSEFVIRDVAISAGPVAPVPFRATRTEEFLRGREFSDETLERAAEVLLSEAQPRTSAHRATKEYRVELLPVLLRRTLTNAVGRAQTHR
jgi:carbon-monoxide dehydrogenase medium subunit